MENTAIVFNLTVIFLAALVGGSIAESLKQSPVIGYILGGLLVGPYTTGLVTDLQMVNSLANLGIILLMFTLGIEFSLSRLARVKRIAIFGGAVQIMIIIGLGMIAAEMLGFSWYQAFFLGCILSVSSTMIVLRVLDEQGEMNSLHGQIMMGILIVQDLAVVLMVSVLPNLKTASGQSALPVLASLGKAVIFVTLMVFLAQKVVPALLERSARRSNNDIFLLLALSLGLGIALGSQAMGLSLSLGAFMAGLVVSESEYAHEIIGKVVSLRDAFVVIFFVSVGLLIDPKGLLGNWLELAVILAVIFIGKFTALFCLTRAFGFHSRVAFAVGMGMMQTGEFSFVMAKMGMDNGLISARLYNLVLASALISIILTPTFMRASDVCYDRLQSLRFLSWFMPDLETDDTHTDDSLQNHVILLGCGRMGRSVADGINRLNLPLIVVDYDYAAIKYLAGRKIDCIYGDASNPLVLEQAHPRQAILAVSALPDAFHSRQAILHLHRLNPGLVILVRAHNQWQKEMLKEAGATAVVQPESEAGFQMVRQIILNMELSDETVQRYLDSMYHADYDRVLRERGFEPVPREQLRAEEFQIEGSPLIGLSLKESGIRETTGCNIAAIHRSNGDMIVNPPSHEIIDEGDILIAMGKAIELGQLRKLVQGIY